MSTDKNMSATLIKNQTQAVAQPVILNDQGGARMDANTEGLASTLRKETHGHEQIVAGIGIDGGETAFALRASGSHSGDKGDGGMNTTTVAVGMAVRRLTPRECERLQGFPDDWTAIPRGKKTAEQCEDGPRYKALGNSMAVPCMAWIGWGIAAVDQIPA